VLMLKDKGTGKPMQMKQPAAQNASTVTEP